jgi:hypothetical protein
MQERFGEQAHWVKKNEKWLVKVMEWLANSKTFGSKEWQTFAISMCVFWCRFAAAH